MELRFVAPIASAAAATPVFWLQPASATANARPATRAVMLRISDSLVCEARRYYTPSRPVAIGRSTGPARQSPLGRTGAKLVTPCADAPGERLRRVETALVLAESEMVRPRDADDVHGRGKGIRTSFYSAGPWRGGSVGHRGHPQRRLKIAAGAELDEAAIDQLTPPVGRAEVGQEASPAAGVRLVHHVGEHRVHHDAFFGVGLPEPPLEFGEDGFERRVVPPLGAGLEAREGVEHRGVGGARRLPPERDVHAEVGDVTGKAERGPSGNAVGERRVEAAHLVNGQ